MRRMLNKYFGNDVSRINWNLIFKANYCSLRKQVKLTMEWVEQVMLGRLDGRLEVEELHRRLDIIKKHLLVILNLEILLIYQDDLE